MRLSLAAPLFSTVMALCACDLVVEPDGPRPEDFAARQDTAEVASDQESDDAIDDAKRDVISPLRPLTDARLRARLERVAE